jgi:hypothetical protein
MASAAGWLPVDIGAAFQRLDVLHRIKEKRFIIGLHVNPPASTDNLLYQSSVPAWGSGLNGSSVNRKPCNDLQENNTSFNLCD